MPQAIALTVAQKPVLTHNIRDTKLPTAGQVMFNSLLNEDDRYLHKLVSVIPHGACQLSHPNCSGTICQLQNID